MSAINGMLGSIDANEGDTLLGWDVDRFPANVYSATFAMLEVIKAGGLTGGFNFDAKNRRASNTYEDMFKAFVLGMDTFALGLLNAEAIIKDGRIDKFVEDRYASFKTGIGAKVRDHSATLEDLAAHALETKVCPDPGSGDEEELQEILNQVMFGKK
jgi:xylose isomerase